MAKIILIILIILASIGAYFGFKKFASTKPYQINQLPSSTPTLSITSKTKTFQSTILKFSIEIPDRFTVSENSGRVVLSSTEGKIYIDRNGTNFSNIDDYVKDLSSKNKITLMSQERSITNGLESISGIVDADKEYFIYTENWVYLLSTSSKSLYLDLDQIAQSFRYIP